MMTATNATTPTNSPERIISSGRGAKGSTRKNPPTAHRASSTRSATTVEKAEARLTSSVSPIRYARATSPRRAGKMLLSR